MPTARYEKSLGDVPEHSQRGSKGDLPAWIGPRWIFTSQRAVNVHFWELVTVYAFTVSVS